MNIFLTSVGRRTYMVNYFMEALLGIGEVHAANNLDTYSIRAADKSVITPKIYDFNYTEFLLDYCLNNSIKALIPLFDIDIPVLAKNKKKFEDLGVKVFVPGFEIAQVCNDKWRTFQFLLENKIKTPKTWISLESLKKDIESKNAMYPIFIKPRWGMGSIGIFEAENQNELDVLYLKSLKAVSSTYLRYESKAEQEKSIVFQEKLIGDEFGLDVFNDLEGNFLTCIPKRKLAMRAGETDMAEIIENNTLFTLGKELSRFIAQPGNLDVDCFFVNGEFYVLEMNCRFGGQYPFCHLAGANFPKAIVNLLLNKSVPVELLKAKPGVVGCKDLNPVVFNK